MKWTKEKLIEFEAEVARLFKQGKISCPTHLSGGNEDQLISIFNSIKKKDYVFSTHRNHYHYLLKGGDPDKLMDEIAGKTTGICHGCGRSMHVFDIGINFYTSAIVGGCCSISVGTALALKHRGKQAHVWVFVGDGAEDSGHFYEAVRFSLGRKLPITFIVEDNDLAVETSKQKRWHQHIPIMSEYILRYSYTRTYPHVGVGEHVSM